MLKLSALDVFTGSIHSPATKTEYMYKLKKYEMFFEITDWDEYIKKDQNEIHDHLVYYINSQKKREIKNHTIRGMMSPVYLMLEMSKVTLFKKILQKMLPEDTSPRGGKLPYLTTEIDSMIKSTEKFRIRALIHFLASTGTRPGGIVDPVLRMKHLKPIDDCYGILIYDESDEGYWGFLTPEAAKALNQYHKSRKLSGEQFTDETPIFSNTHDTHNSKGKPITSRTVREIMYRVLDKADVIRIKKGRRYDKAAIYGFRKRFNTILKINNDVNSNIAEKMMAHKNGLDGTYFQPTMNECFTEFKKAIPELTVDGFARKQVELNQKEKENSELQKQVDEINSLKEDMESVKLRQESKVSVTDPKILELIQSKEFIELLNNKLKSKP